MSDWIAGLKTGDERSVDELWQRYFQRLVKLADRRLPRGIRPVFDGEDVALSAFHSLCAGVVDGRFPELRSRDELWSLLIVITARKALRKGRSEGALKRGGGWRAESAEVAEIAGSEPSPEFAAQVVDETERLVELLGDDDLRALARGKLEGLTNGELAERLGCTVRTVERRLALVRRLWTERGLG